MTNTSSPKPPSREGLGPVAWSGAALLMVACCAGPALIASGVAAGILGAVGTWLANPWLIGAAATAAAVVAILFGRRVIRRVPDSDSCSPEPPTTDRSAHGSAKARRRKAPR